MLAQPKYSDNIRIIVGKFRRTMDSDKLRGFEEEVGRLWVEIPLERREGRHDIRHIE